MSIKIVYCKGFTTITEDLRSLDFYHAHHKAFNFVEKSKDKSEEIYSHFPKDNSIDKDDYLAKYESVDPYGTLVAAYVINQSMIDRRKNRRTA